MEEDDNEKLIYRNEYDQLPQDVREYFAEAINLINRANQAAKAEEEAVKEYNLIHTRVNTENQNGMQLTDLKEKVADIEETEKIASRIIEAQTFWKYEGIPAPGDNEKLHMDASTLQKLIDDLGRISDTLENPNLESNPKKLKEEVLSAKDYIQQLRSALPAYSNVATLKSAIFDTEATIAVYEDVVTSRTKEANFHAANSRKEKSASTARESGRTSSRDLFSQEIEDEEREKRKRKRKQEDTPGSSDTPDLMDRVMKIKMMKSNAPLTSTPAGQYMVKKSMKPLSSLVGIPRRGGDDDPHDSNDGRDHDDDDDDGNEGRKGRDRDDDDGSRRGRDWF